jgi:hypothetical protein
VDFDQLQDEFLERTELRPSDRVLSEIGRIVLSLGRSSVWGASASGSLWKRTLVSSGSNEFQRSFESETMRAFISYSSDHRENEWSQYEVAEFEPVVREHSPSLRFYSSDKRANEILVDLIDD